MYVHVCMCTRERERERTFSTFLGFSDAYFLEHIGRKSEQKMAELITYMHIQTYMQTTMNISVGYVL